MSWSARARDRDLMLGGPVGFSSATLVRNYNAPSALMLTGRLNSIREAMVPGGGIVLLDEDGNQQFSGLLTSTQRNGDGTGVLMFASDLVRLYWRTVWPTPGSAWESQTVPHDTLTAPAETRALWYINRNAGPGAYKQFSSGSVPVGTVIPAELVTLTPGDKSKVFQTVDYDEKEKAYYATQATDRGDGKPDDLRISRFNADGEQTSTMTLPGGGHGQDMSIVRYKDKIHCVYPYRYITGDWVRIPYTPGKVWKSTQALAYKIDKPKLYKPGNIYNAAPPKSSVDPRQNAPWFQGGTFYDGKFYWLYGSPYVDSGPRGGGTGVPGRIEVWENNAKVQTINIPQLGREGNVVGGNPIKGQLEPEGIAVGMVLGQPSLLIGISCGFPASNNVEQRMFSMSLAPKATPVIDRRFPRLRVPVSEGRGDTAVSSLRFQTLGNAVASMLESSDLRVDVVQTYEGQTPWLDVQVTEAPDMTDTIRVGTPDEGGPIVLSREWTYKVELNPDTYASTILSGAGGTLTQRILTQATDAQRESFWGHRVERFINQTDVTDSAEIEEGMTEALLEAIDSTEISVPLGYSAYGFGTDIPLGAKISAVLDGEVITERIRQITSVIQKASGEPTVKTSAVLGSADAGVKSPTQKALAKMLRRVQNLERG